MPLFSFKSRIKDFVVDEQLPFELQPKGNFFLVKVEKENVNTMDVVEYCIDELRIPKNAIGYAGLKDKFAVAKQWFSFDVNQIMKKFPEKQVDKLIIQTLRRACTTIKSGWSDKPLTIKDDFINQFTIRLRPKKKLQMVDKEHIEYVLNKLFSKPIPNFFGEQRFGIKGQNIEQGFAILSGEDRTTSGFDRHFKLQAYASFIFNEILEKRVQFGSQAMDGDFLQIDKKIYLFEEGKLYEQQDWHKKQSFFVYAKNEGKSVKFETSDYQVILPVLGYNTLVPPVDTDLGGVIQSIMRRHEINSTTWKLYKELEIYGIFRNAWINPIKPSRKREENDLMLSFGLPAGAYASVVVDQLQTMVDETPRKRVVNKVHSSKTHGTQFKPEDHSADESLHSPSLGTTQPAVLPQHQQQRKRKVHRKGLSKSKV